MNVISLNLCQPKCNSRICWRFSNKSENTKDLLGVIQFEKIEKLKLHGNDENKRNRK